MNEQGHDVLLRSHASYDGNYKDFKGIVLAKRHVR